MPVCVPLAVAVGSDSDLPGMDRTDHISPEVASHGCLRPHVYTRHQVVSESGFAGFACDNCIWTGILPEGKLGPGQVLNAHACLLPTLQVFCTSCHADQ